MTNRALDAVNKQSNTLDTQSLLHRDLDQQEQGPFLQRRTAHLNAPAQLTPQVDQVLNEPGLPLSSDTRSQMESSFNHDFSNVRIHTAANAAESAKSANAHAYTMGNHIVFAHNQYQPDTESGQQLLAHELTHVVQQRNVTPTTQNRIAKSGYVLSQQNDPLERQAQSVAQQLANGQTVTAGSVSPATGLLQPLIARQEATATAPPQPKPKLEADAGSEVGETAVADSTEQEQQIIPKPTTPIDLAGSNTFKAERDWDTYFNSKEGQADTVPVKFGKFAQGNLPIQKNDGGYRTARSRKRHSIPLSHSFLAPLEQAGLQPILAISMKNSQYDGYVTIAAEKGRVGQAKEVVQFIQKHSEEMGWLGFELPQLPKFTNNLNNGKINLGFPQFNFRLGGFLTGKGNLGLVDEQITFKAESNVKVKNLAEANLLIERDEAGHLNGEIEAPINIANFEGNLFVKYMNGIIDARGMVGYNTEKFSGQVTLLLTDPKTARNVAKDKLTVEALEQSANNAAGKGEEGAKKGARALAGFGTLKFAFTEWMTGEATVIIDSEGQLTIIGEIAPPAEIELFPQKDYIKKLFKVEVRTAYGVPLVGNIFLFANVRMEALAKIGPGKIHQIEITAQYSQDPEIPENFEMAGSLNISAFAGLRAKAQGGAGVELVGHDIKAGAEINGTAGVRGFVDARPTIGYRESAEPKEGKQGELFFKGKMEIAAQPFLGLDGKLFVELDSPWWSPAPDKTWDWPIGSLEYILPGEFGIGAEVDYVLGSGKWPEIEFGEVAFDKDKFMTDLMNDHVPKKQKGEQDKAGKWQEGDTKVENAEGKIGKKPLTAQGEGVKPPKAIQKKSGLPKRSGQGRQSPQDGRIPSPQHEKRWLNGVKALGELSENSKKDPLDKTEIGIVTKKIKSQFGFSSLEISPQNEDWLVDARMNPEGEFKIEGEASTSEGNENETSSKENQAQLKDGDPIPSDQLPAGLPKLKRGDQVGVFDGKKQRIGDFVGYFMGIKSTTLAKIDLLSKPKITISKPISMFNKPKGWGKLSDTSISYSSLDSKGRATSANATLRSPFKADEKSNYTPVGFDSSIHDRSHLIARQFGGNSNEPRNMMPLLSRVNQDVMEPIERQVRRKADTGEIVDYTVTPRYIDDNLTPNEVDIVANGEEGFSLSRKIVNK